VRAVVLEGAGRVAVRDVPEPRVEEPGDAVVRVSSAAICGSDLHFLHGRAPLEPGGVMGHECVGRVEAVGANVRSFGKGDRVVASFQIACGRCWFCARGQTQLCETSATLGAGAFGGGLSGAQAERVRIPSADVNLLAVPSAVPDDRAIFVGDVLATGLYAAALASPEAAATVAVIGGGPLGYACVLGLRALGVGRILVLEPDERRRSLASAAGAQAIDVGARNAQMAVAEATEDRGADAVIEAVGATDAFDESLEIVRRGGTVVVAGVYAGDVTELQLGVAWMRALRLTFTGICPVHAWWRRAMEEVESARLDPSPIISHRLPLEDAAIGYALFDERTATKVLLQP
jgi:2-desacetyl-2-hydroxyethyl bacteriochlorophyllide A dehydrogenase